MEIVLIILVIAILFGWSKLPDAARSLGRSMRIFKSEVEEMKRDKPSEASRDTVPGTTVPPTPPPPAPQQQAYQQQAYQQQAYQPPAPQQAPYVPPPTGQPQQAPYQPPTDPTAPPAN